MDEDVEHRLALLGHDVAFMGEKTHKVVSENYLVKLSQGHDIKKFSVKMARVLEGIIKNSVCYAKDLCDIVSKSKYKDDLAEITKLLDTMVSLDDKFLKNGGKHHQTTDSGKNEQKKNGKKDFDCYPDFQIKQESIHIAPTEVPDSFKAELPSDNEQIDNEVVNAVQPERRLSDTFNASTVRAPSDSDSTEDYVFSNVLKNKTNPALNNANDTFDASTVRAPSPFGTDASSVQAPPPIDHESFETDAPTVRAPSPFETNSTLQNKDQDAFDSDAFSVENEPLTERIKKKIKKEKDIEQQGIKDKQIEDAKLTAIQENSKRNNGKLKDNNKLIDSDSDEEVQIKQTSKERNKDKHIDSDSDEEVQIKQTPKERNKDKHIDSDAETEDNIKKNIKANKEKIINKNKLIDSDSESDDNIKQKPKGKKGKSSDYDSKVNDNIKEKSKQKKENDSDLESDDTIKRVTKNKNRLSDHDSESEDNIKEKSKQISKSNKEKLKNKSKLNDSDLESDDSIKQKPDCDSEVEDDIREKSKKRSKRSKKNVRNQNKLADSDSESEDSIKQKRKDRSEDTSKTFESISENEVPLNNKLKGKNKPKPLRFKLRDLEKEKALNKKLEKEKIKEEVVSDSDRITEESVDTNQSPQRKTRPKPLRFKLRDEEKKLKSQEISNLKIKQENVMSDSDNGEKSSKSKKLNQYDSSPLISSDSEVEELKLSRNKKTKKKKAQLKRKKEKEVKDKTYNEEGGTNIDIEDKKKKTDGESGEHENGETKVATLHKTSSGTKIHTDSEHISELETPTVTDYELDHNDRGEHQSDQETDNDTKKQDLENPNKKNTEPVTDQKSKLDKKKLLLKIIDEFYKKKKTQRNKKTEKSSDDSTKFGTQDDNLSSGTNKNVNQQNDIVEETHRDEVNIEETEIANEVTSITEKDETLKETPIEIDEEVLTETQIDPTEKTETSYETQTNEEMLMETQIDEVDLMEINQNVKKESESLDLLNDFDSMDIPLLSHDVESSEINDNTTDKKIGTEKLVGSTEISAENDDCENQNIDQVKSKSNDSNSEPLELNNPECSNPNISDATSTENNKSAKENSTDNLDKMAPENNDKSIINDDSKNEFESDSDVETFSPVTEHSYIKRDKNKRGRKIQFDEENPQQSKSCSEIENLSDVGDHTYFSSTTETESLKTTENTLEKGSKTILDSCAEPEDEPFKGFSSEQTSSLEINSIDIEGDKIGEIFSNTTSEVAKTTLTNSTAEDLGETPASIEPLVFDTEGSKITENAEESNSSEKAASGSNTDTEGSLLESVKKKKVKRLSSTEESSETSEIIQKSPKKTRKISSSDEDSSETITNNVENTCEENKESKNQESLPYSSASTEEYSFNSKDAVFVQSPESLEEDTKNNEGPRKRKLSETSNISNTDLDEISSKNAKLDKSIEDKDVSEQNDYAVVGEITDKNEANKDLVNIYSDLKEVSKDADNSQALINSYEKVHMGDADKTPVTNVNGDLHEANKDVNNLQDITDSNGEVQMCVDNDQQIETDSNLQETTKDDDINLETKMIVDDQETPENDEIFIENKEEESENNEDSFKLNDKDRDELLELLDERYRTIKNDVGDTIESNKTADEENMSNERIDLGEEINRELLLELLQEYEECIISGKAFTAEDEVCEEEGQEKNLDELEREDNKTPEPLLELRKEEEFVQSTPGKKGRKKTEQRQAAEIFKKLMADDSDLESSSSISIESSPCKSIDSYHSDVEVNHTKKSLTFKVTKEILDEYGIDKQLVVKVERSDFGDIDLKTLPKSAKEAVNIERLCDLTNVLQQRKSTTSNSGPETSKKLHKKKRDLSSKSRSASPFSDCDDQSETGSRSQSRIEARSPSLDFHSDDSQEAMARAFMDRLKGDSSDDNSPLLSSGGDLSSDSDHKTKKKKKLAEKLASGSEASSDEEGSKDKEKDKNMSEKESDAEEKKQDEDHKSEEDEAKKKKSPKVLTAEEKRKKRWKRNPLLHGRMLSSGPSSSDSDSDAASIKSDASERRRKQMDRLKSKYDLTSPEKDVKKSDQDKEKSDSDSDRIMNEIAARHNIKKERTDRESDSDSSSVEFVSTKMKTPIKEKRKKDTSGTETDDDVVAVDSPSKGKGRRNIRELLSDEALAIDTKKANEEEKKRIKRLEEKKSQRETFSQSQSFGSQDSEEDALVLDIDKKTLEPLIKVHPKITRRLKPHQRDGIQFMWDSCYESCDQLKKGWKGSGCILAHCMGLGKTLQVLALIHTIFTYNDITKSKHVLVVCPLSTVSNWRNEYKLAYKKIPDCDINIFTIEDRKTKENKFIIIKRWRRRGGILIMGYEAFGNLTNDVKLDKWEKQNQCNKEEVLEALVKPGPDLVVCDEGHLLKNKKTIRNISLNKVSTRRRIVLTGTPLQNNLIEYYCMVNFVKPNLLGNEKEYKIQFVNPITNGQYEDSTPGDIKLMKYRTHILHRVLKGTVQRVEDTELKKYLPKLVDYALFVQISDMQIDFYNKYMDLASDQLEYNKEGNVCQKNFLADVVMSKYICSHPYLLSVVDRKAKKKVKEQDVIDDSDDEHMPSTVVTSRWWRNMLPDDSHERLELGNKIMLALKIVEEAEALDEKVLIFSNYHGEMDVLEHFLSMKGTKACPSWKKRQDYYRMDGTIVPEERAFMCQKFNDPKNTRLRVFIMSTKVGGLGLNLTAATRIVIMTVNWNPSYDTQSVFRAYRFGQDKPVFVYRLISMSTLEEKIYQRSVTKLAVAHRVVDKHQIKRAFTRADIEEMYNLRPTKDTERPLPNYPEDDKLLAKLIQNYKCVFRWHEHQGLLANRPEEELSAQEKEAAWEEFNQKQEAPQMPPFGGNLMPNMGALAAMHLINAYGGNMNNTDLMNMLKTYNNVPKVAVDHDYSLPTSTNTNVAAPNNMQPRNIFNSNQPPNPNQPPVVIPSTSTSTAINVNNVPNFQATGSATGSATGATTFNNNNFINMTSTGPQPSINLAELRNKINLIQNPQVRNMAMSRLNNLRLPASTTLSTTTAPNLPKFQSASTVLNNTKTKNWLTNQLPQLGPDRPLRFSLKINDVNEAGVNEISWPGSRIQKTQAGVIYFSYLPSHFKGIERNLKFESHTVKAPDGSDLKIYTAAAPSYVPTQANAVKPSLRNSNLISVNKAYSGMPNKAQIPISLPAGTQMTPVPIKPLGFSASTATTSTNSKDNFVKGHVIKETSKGREIVPVRALNSSAYDPPPLIRSVGASKNAGGPPIPSTTTSATPITLKPGIRPPPPVQNMEGSAIQDPTKQVVPNPFAASHIKSNSVPVIRRVPEANKNLVKAVAPTGTKQVVPNPLNSHVRLAQTPSPKPPPAHTGRAVGSPTVAKPPKLVSNRSIENLSPASQVVDLSASKTGTNPPQPKRPQNLLRSPPNQNINANVRSASNNPGIITNSPKTAAVNSPSPRNAKPGTSGVFVTSKDISNPPRGTKRAFDGGGSPSTSVNKKLLLLNDQRKSAMPSPSPRPPAVGTAIKSSPQDLYKQMMKNVDYKGLISTNKNKLQANPPGVSSSQLATTSNKENRRNRLQLNPSPSSHVEDDELVMVDGGPVNNRTLEKLKKDGVSISKVDKNDSGVIHLD